MNQSMMDIGGGGGFNAKSSIKLNLPPISQT